MPKPNEAVIEGRVIHVGEVQTFSSGFTKKELVIETPGKYPQPIAVELIKDDTDRADGSHLHKQVRAHCNIRGRAWNDKHFISLQAWRLEWADQGGNGGSRPPEIPASDCPDGMAPDQRVEDVMRGTDGALPKDENNGDIPF